jgi:hypothetical protein
VSVRNRIGNRKRRQCYEKGNDRQYSHMPFTLLPHMRFPCCALRDVTVASPHGEGPRAPRSAASLTRAIALSAAGFAMGAFLSRQRSPPSDVAARAHTSGTSGRFFRPCP